MVASAKPAAVVLLAVALWSPFPDRLEHLPAEQAFAQGCALARQSQLRGIRGTDKAAARLTRIGRKTRRKARATPGTAEGRTTSVDSRRPTDARASDAQRLLSEIAEVLGTTGLQAGAMRTVQAFLAIAATIDEISRDGDGERVVESLRQLGLRSRAAELRAGPPEALMARILRKLFQRLGATYVKLGQFIASAPSLFPEAYVREFQSCLDQTPATDFETIKRTVEAELGRPLSAVFRSFEKEPIASASVAQVHIAVLSTGREVAVKVQKPDSASVLKADLAFLYIGARVLEFLVPAIASSSVVELLAEIRSTMLQELDFRQELKNLEVFRTFLSSGLESIAAAPRPYPELSGQRVLVMERFRGVPMTDLRGIRRYSSNPEATLISALNVWALSVRNCELFHADVHAGNLLVLEDGRVGFIDFGIVGRVPPKIWTATEGLLVAFVAKDYRGMAKNLIAMGATGLVDETKLSADIEKVLEKLSSLEPEVVIRQDGREVSAELEVESQRVTELLLEVTRAAQANGLKLPREFALLVKQALYFDRYTKLLAPGLDPIRDSRVDLGVAGNSASAGYLWRKQATPDARRVIDV